MTSSTTSANHVAANNLTSSVTADVGSTRQWPEVTVAVKIVSNLENGLHWSVVARAVCYIILFIVGFIGNLLVLAVTVWRRNRKQVVAQVLMIALAICDSAVMLLATWENSVGDFKSTWVFGTFMCKLLLSLRPTSGDWSIWTIAIISMDRFLGMSRPESSFFAVGGIARLIVFVWMAVLAINLPISFYTDTLVVPSGPTTTMVVCARLIHMDPYVQEVFQVAGRIFIFFVPLGLTWASYAGIFWRMARTKRKVAVIDKQHSSEPNGQQQRQVQQSSATKKVGRMCATIASVFTLCWTPFQVMVVLQYLGVQSVLNYMQTVFLLPALNSCVNPIIYGFMYKPFRQGLQLIIGKCIGRWTKADLSATGSGSGSVITGGTMTALRERQQANA